jgi:hypothetical protein
MAQFVDKDGKPLSKHSSNLFIMASETSIARKAEICRGVMTLHQTEQWSFITKEAMRALRKPLVNFKGCTTASQCIGPIDLPDGKDVWQLTVGVKKKIYGDAIQRPGGPDPMVPRSAADPAADGDEQPQKPAATTRQWSLSHSTVQPKQHGKKFSTLQAQTTLSHAWCVSWCVAMPHWHSFA